MAYRPGTPPSDLSPESLLDYVLSELETIATEFSETSVLELRPIHVEPKKPREGMLVYADGTDWNPGSGKGVYVRGTASWSKL